MNIGVIGWWNNGNQGDFAILDNMTQALAPHRVVPIDAPFAAVPDELERLNLLDFIVLGGGGLFTSKPAVPFDTFEDWAAGLRAPLGIVGLGVDEIRPEHRRSVQMLIDSASFVYVRDETSRRLLNADRVQLMPDVTFFQPRPNRPHRTTAPAQPMCGVNLRSLTPAYRQKWIAALRALPMQMRGVPLATYRAFEELETLRLIDPEVQSTYDDSIYDQLDIMIGTAYHSIIFAIQAGVPVIAIAYAPKVRRLMNELGLSEYVLGVNEWAKLPLITQRALAAREGIAARLCEITRQLSHSTRQTMIGVKQIIESAGQPHATNDPKVSIVVVGFESAVTSRATIESCLGQTHSNLEVIWMTSDHAQPPTDIGASTPPIRIVACAPAASLAQRINLGLAQANGEYLTWINAGDRYALDAIAAMTHHLQREPSCAAVYADFYALREPRVIAAACAVIEANKLVRRNVVGPCFLWRHKLHEKIGTFDPNAALPDYDFWLRASRADRLQPIHARLYYQLQSNDPAGERKRERQTRHHYRMTQAWAWRTVWNIIDTELIESLIVQPILKTRRRIKSLRSLS